MFNHLKRETMTHYQKALNYAASQLTRLEAEYAVRNEANRMPIENDFVCKVADLMEEYSQDNDIPEGWWLYEADEEDTAYKVATILLDNN